MPTTREQLEKTVADMKAFADECDAKGSMTSRDRERLDDYSRKATALVAQIKGQDTLDALSGDAGASLVGALKGEEGAAPTSYPWTGGDWRKSSGGWGAAVVKAATGTDGTFKSLLANGSVPVSVPLNPTPARDSERLQFLRQAIGGVQAPSGRFSYMRQTTRTNNAAPVAQGALKPTSVYTLTRVDDRTRTIAHLSEPIAKQDLADATMLRQFVDNELRYGLELELDDQILNGSGTGENLTGILSTTGTLAQAWSTDHLTTTRKAITILEKAEEYPDLWVLNPDDWEAIELAASDPATANGYQSAPVDRMTRRLWGVRVVVSNAIATGVGLLGNFRDHVELHITDDARVDWSENVYDKDALGTDQGASDFERNMVRFRCEGRFGLAVKRPGAFVEVDLTSA